MLLYSKALKTYYNYYTFEYEIVNVNIKIRLISFAFLLCLDAKI